MIAFVIPLLLVLLVVLVVKSRKAGRSGGEIALIIVGGIICIVAATFGVLVWGFSGFDKPPP